VDAEAAMDESPFAAHVPAADASPAVVTAAGMAGGGAVAAAAAAQEMSDYNDLDESAVTGSAGMAQAPLVAVALGGTQGLAWPGSPGGGGVSPASMLLMESGLPSPRGVAALMARTPQRAGMASVAAAPAAEVGEGQGEAVNGEQSD
jgi:hypothetical protein